MKQITLEQLLEAGCHFGHQITRQNPKARDYIFEARDGIHIIDLAKTKEGLQEAAEFIRSVSVKEDAVLLIVGTKRQAQTILESEVKRAKDRGIDSISYVTNRWVGGVLTNFSEVLKNIKKLKDLTENIKSEEFKSKYTKKEIGLWEKEIQKLESLYGGIANMTKLPDAIFVVDTHLENLAVREAIRMGIDIAGITDTNSDPTIIDYAIPANDDAVGSVQIITSYIIDAWIEGKKSQELRSKDQEEEKKAEQVKEEKPADKEKSKEEKTSKKEKSPKKQKDADSKPEEKPKKKTTRKKKTEETQEVKNS